MDGAGSWTGGEGEVREDWKEWRVHDSLIRLASI